MEKTIYELELHESMRIHGGEIEVMRVASGWNYAYYIQKESSNGNEYWEIGNVLFVPFDNLFQETKR